MLSRLLAALATVLVVLLTGGVAAGTLLVLHDERVDEGTVEKIIARAAPAARAAPTARPSTPTTAVPVTPAPRPSGPAPAATPVLPAVPDDPLLALTWPTPRPPAAAPAPVEPAPTPPNSALASRLATIVAADELTLAAPYGMAVVDNWGREIFGHHAELPLLPASTNKLVVAAAALRTFGPEQRLATVVATTAAPDAQGVVRGDLVMVGGGDPTLSSPEYAAVDPQRPRTPVADLAASIRAAGITAVEGRILAEPGIFAHDLEPQGWAPRYLDTLDAARIAGLTVDVGRHLVVRERDGALLGVASGDPALEAAHVLTRLLVESDVEVAGAPALATPDHPDAAARARATVVAAVESPPMSTLLAYMVARSDNHIADTVFRLLGTVGADGTWGGSSRAVRRSLEPLGLDWTGVRLSDGSGLSRTNRLTAAFLADLDEVMLSSGDADRWRDLMAVAGRSGTLRGRYRSTPAGGAVFGKTGALRDVRALAGSVDAAPPRRPPADEASPAAAAPSDGSGPSAPIAPHRYHFAVVGNDLEGADLARLRRLMDLVVLTLAAELRGCGEWVPAPVDADARPPSAPAQPPPETAVCPAA